LTSFPQTNFGTQLGLLARRCSWFATLSDEERAFLRTLEYKPRRPHRARTRLWHPGSAGPVVYLVSGWAVHARELLDGRRLLFDVLLPGDIVGLGVERVANAQVFAVTAGRTLEAGELSRLLLEKERLPGICKSLELAAAEQSRFRVDHLMRLGRQNAMERIAHFFLELEHRLRQRGMSQDGAIPLPLTQEVIGDVLGLSLVHVNRTLQQLRRDEMIRLEHGQLKLLKMPELAMLSEFHAPTPATLHGARA
jgi:CRP-like cAMP-binding protein